MRAAVRVARPPGKQDRHRIEGGGMGRGKRKRRERGVDAPDLPVQAHVGELAGARGDDRLPGGDAAELGIG